jgi:LPXTG-motif cell wall-anchored protein
MTSGAYAGWNAKVPGFEHDEAGQAALFNEVLRWGVANGLSGIRWWGTDYVSDSWEPMSMFSKADDGRKVGLAKQVLLERLPLSPPAINDVTPNSVAGTGVPGATAVVTDGDGASLCDPVRVAEQGTFSCSFTVSLTQDDRVEVSLIQAGRPASATATVPAPTPEPDPAASSWTVTDRTITAQIADQYGNQIALQDGDMLEAALTAASARAHEPAIGAFEATSVAGTYRAVVADDVAGRFDLSVTLNGIPVLHTNGDATVAAEFASAPVTGGGTSSPAPGSATPGTTSSSGSLASTGFDGGAAGMAIAGALLLSGAVLSLARRRRARVTSPVSSR